MLFKPNKMELSPRLKLGVGRSYGQNQILKFAGLVCLILAAILTINAARLILKNSSNSSAGSAPQVLGASDVKQPSSQPATIEFTTYTVQKGDTLFDISQKFNISWTTLATLNNLKSPFTLKAGQIIKIPK